MSSRFWGSILGILVILWQTMPALKIVNLSIETLDAIVDIEHEAYKLRRISRIIGVSSSLDVARIPGMNHRARVADTAMTFPQLNRNPRI
jgi:hypothetical protein